MKVKLFEVRDRMTFIPVIAIKLDARDAREEYLLKRCGYSTDGITEYVLLTKLATDTIITYDPARHAGGARTMPLAHRYIQEHFDEMTSGDVVDIEFIANETATVKTSERIS